MQARGPAAPGDLGDGGQGDGGGAMGGRGGGGHGVAGEHEEKGSPRARESHEGSGITAPGSRTLSWAPHPRCPLQVDGVSRSGPI